MQLHISFRCYFWAKLVLLYGRHFRLQVHFGTSSVQSMIWVLKFHYCNQIIMSTTVWRSVWLKCWLKFCRCWTMAKLLLMLLDMVDCIWHHLPCNTWVVHGIYSMALAGFALCLVISVPESWDPEAFCYPKILVIIIWDLEKIINVNFSVWFLYLIIGFCIVMRSLLKYSVQATFCFRVLEQLSLIWIRSLILTLISRCVTLLISK